MVTCQYCNFGPLLLEDAFTCASCRQKQKYVTQLFDMVVELKDFVSGVPQIDGADVILQRATSIIQKATS